MARSGRLLPGRAHAGAGRPGPGGRGAGRRRRGADGGPSGGRPGRARPHRLATAVSTRVPAQPPVAGDFLADSGISESLRIAFHSSPA
ncbi:hypothetical protein D0Z67_22935 [Streptomyces seoulensis]|uniref:Uncharacterized protein n=1 Tax=Streptomyces seoulensis TaxID=73044 RepID=A0A4P6U1K6_STRSO|nr:hypothetical protein D0Z67_22935 [Streptomyces seoulensis]